MAAFLEAIDRTEIMGSFVYDEGCEIDCADFTEEDRIASRYVVSDEICCGGLERVLEHMEDNGILYHHDDDCYHLTAKGLACLNGIH